MESNAIIGIIVTAAALAGSTYLVLWSRRTIERIARGKNRSARAILKDLDNGK
jgi:hypothetical protein